MLNPWTGHSNPLTAFRMKGLSLGRRNVFLYKYGNTSFTSIAPVGFRLRLVQHLPVAKGTLSPCWIFISWRQNISMFVLSASLKKFRNPELPRIDIQLPDWKFYEVSLFPVVMVTRTWVRLYTFLCEIMLPSSWTTLFWHVVFKSLFYGFLVLIRLSVLVIGPFNQFCDSGFSLTFSTRSLLR